ncbi:hypothetical protein OQA88_12509 [Cercophora sp. LCS_1]
MRPMFWSFSPSCNLHLNFRRCSKAQQHYLYLSKNNTDNNIFGLPKLHPARHLDWSWPSLPKRDLATLLCWAILATLISAEVIDDRMSRIEKIICCISGIALAHGPLIVLWTARCSSQRRHHHHHHHYHRGLASTVLPRRVDHFRNRERRDARGVRIRSRLPPVQRIIKKC